MAIINLSNEKIESLSTEIESLDSTLLGSYIPELTNVISEIKSNVLNEQVNQILGTISSQVETISGELKTDLPKLEQFLASQMTEYTATEAEAEQKVNNVLQKMQAFATGTAVTAGSASASGGVEARLSALEKENAELKEANKSNWEKANDNFVDDFLGDGREYGSRVANDWGNVGESFSQGNILSGIGDTIGATASTLWNTGGLIVTEAINGGDWIVDQVFGEDTLLGGVLDIFS